MPTTPVQTIVDLLPRVAYACRRLDARALTTGRSLSPQQANVLDQLDADVPISLRALAAQMGVTAPTMSVAIGRLVREGYVRRDRDPIDGRRLDLTLSAAGVRVRKVSSALDPRRVAKLLARVSATDRAVALRGIAALARAARQEPEASERGARTGPPLRGTSKKGTRKRSGRKAAARGRRSKSTRTRRARRG
jgi:DNA-binding MarR family transcriptional regulator